MAIAGELELAVAMAGDDMRVVQGLGVGLGGREGYSCFVCRRGVLERMVLHFNQSDL